MKTINSVFNLALDHSLEVSSSPAKAVAELYTSKRMHLAKTYAILAVLTQTPDKHKARTLSRRLCSCCSHTGVQRIIDEWLPDAKGLLSLSQHVGKTKCLHSPLQLLLDPAAVVNAASVTAAAVPESISSWTNNAHTVIRTDKYILGKDDKDWQQKQ